jgi:hypothetical protein
VPHTKTRIVGSGFTTFVYRGQPIAFLERIDDSGQLPVTPTPDVIIPLDAQHAVEIATARALGAGNLVVTVRELWNAPIWNQFVGLQGTNDILDVYNRLSADPAEVTCQMLIKPPGAPWRGKVYHNCTMVGIDDGETVTIGTITVAKTATIWYTHTTPFSLNA